MRASVLPLALFVALTALGTPVRSAPLEAVPSWIVWAEDPSETPVALSSGDIETLSVGTTAWNLHVDLRTRPGSAPPVAATSEASWIADQGGRTAIRFAWGEEPGLWVDGVETQGWQVSDDSGPLGWHVQIPWTAIGVAQAQAFWLRDLDVKVHTGLAPTDTATGPDLEFMPTKAGGLVASASSLAPGMTVEGPDYAGGASITTDGKGIPLVAYYVYDDGRGVERGIYLARIDAGTTAFSPQRLDGTAITRTNGRDGQMRTQVAHDGADTFVLFTDDPAVDNDEDGPGHPGTPDSVYVLARSAQGWAREDPTPGGTSDVGAEDVADLAARDGRVVAAVPVGADVWVAERTGPGAWKELARLQGATSAKLALDSQGTIHVAYVVYESDESSWRSGKLYYATSRDAFVATHAGDNIDSGWEGPETDGSFAIAVGPSDEAALLWNDGRARERNEEQRLAILVDGAWRQEFAPLVPSHGNPQYTMRLAFAADGRLVAASGYGGTDTLAIRGVDGSWGITELPRYDVWDMAVSPGGGVYFGYTQPHGGTTVAVSAYGAKGMHTQGPLLGDGDGAIAELAPGPGLAGLVALAVLAALRRR